MFSHHFVAEIGIGLNFYFEVLMGIKTARRT